MDYRSFVHMETIQRRSQFWILLQQPEMWHLINRQVKKNIPRRTDPTDVSRHERHWNGVRGNRTVFEVAVFRVIDMVFYFYICLVLCCLGPCGRRAFRSLRGMAEDTWEPALHAACRCFTWQGDIGLVTLLLFWRESQTCSPPSEPRFSYGVLPN